MPRIESSKESRRLYSYSQSYLPLKWLKKAGFENVSTQTGFNFFRVHVFSLTLSAVTFILSMISTSLPDKTILMQIYSIFAMFAAWFGGFRAGVICTALMTIEAYFFLYNSFLEPSLPINPHLQISLFFVRGVFVSWLIDRARRSHTITRLKEREEKYARSLVDLTDKFDKAKEEIMRRDEFLSIASHELKTPLTSMLMKLDDQLNTVKNVSLANFSVPQLMKSLEHAKHQIYRLTTMINDLLNVSFITTGRMTLEKESVDLVEITKNVIESFSESLANNG